MKQYSDDYLKGKNKGLELAREFCERRDESAYNVEAVLKTYGDNSIGHSWARVEQEKQDIRTHMLSDRQLGGLLGDIKGHQNAAEFMQGFAEGVQEVHTQRQANEERKSGFKWGVANRHLADRTSDELGQNGEYVKASPAFKEGVQEGFRQSKESGRKSEAYLEALRGAENLAAVRILVMASQTPATSHTQRQSSRVHPNIHR